MRGLFPLFSRRNAPAKPDLPARLIVKIARDGAVYLNHQPAPVDIPTFDAALQHLREHDGLAVYYRERPDEQEAPAALLASFQRIVEARVKITMGQMATSEWGVPSHIEIEEAPMQFRLFVSIGQPLLASVPSPDTDGPGITMVAPASDWSGLLGELDFHVRSDRVRESPQHRQGDCLRETLRAEDAPPGLHLRVGYNRNRDRWSAYYPLDQLPAHIRSFYLACRSVAQRIHAQQAGQGKTISGEDALQIFA